MSRLNWGSLLIGAVVGVILWTMLVRKRVSA
jgi:hypothetical protein